MKVPLLFVLLWHYSKAFTPVQPSSAFIRKPTFSQSTSLQISLGSLFSLSTAATAVPRNQTQETLAKEEASLMEEDFLFAEVKPKILIHERDYFRQATRIQAWDEYVLVSVLCTSISYSALQGFQLNTDHQGIFFYEVLVRSAVQIIAGFGCLAGLYCTMVFSLSILYTRTALGSERDPQYEDFLENTLDIRINAFRAFSMSLGLFAILVVIVLAEDLPEMLHIPVGGVMLWALLFGYRDWKTLVKEATPIYFDIDDNNDA